MDYLDISNTCVMPFRYGVGDHQAFVLDIPLESLVGVSPVQVVRPASQCLNRRLPGWGRAYITSLENNIIQHCLIKRLHEAHTGEYTAEERTRKIIIIDEEGKEYMRHTEKTSRVVSRSLRRHQSGSGESRSIIPSCGTTKGE